MNTLVEVHVAPLPRLCTKREAARYLRLSIQQFERQVRVVPLRMDNGDVLYDREDLHRWIEDKKGGAVSDDDIIGSLR
jgi:hypothetical protein